MTTSVPRRGARPRILGISLIVLILGGLGAGGLLIFSWMVDETHFDRPSTEFDRLEAEIVAVPGVVAVEKERWVEAPIFSSPFSSLRVTLDRAALPPLLDLACSSGYADPVDWGLLVRTPTGAEVSIFSEPAASGCPDFRLDALPTVDAVDRVAPGRSIQAAVWENGRLSFSDLLEGRDISEMIPIVAGADELRRAAGVDDETEVEIAGSTLTVVVAAGEAPAYAALLRTLVDELGVTAFWDGAGGGAPIDGVAKTQVTGDPARLADVEAAIRSSDLRLADTPIVLRED